MIGGKKIWFFNFYSQLANNIFKNDYCSYGVDGILYKITYKIIKLLVLNWKNEHSNQKLDRQFLNIILEVLLILNTNR